MAEFYGPAVRPIIDDGEIENHVLRGGEFRTEPRASIKTFGSDKAKSDWRTCNANAKAIAERNPVWSAERIANHVLERQPSTTERADKIVRPFGTAGDIVKAAAEQRGSRTSSATKRPQML